MKTIFINDITGAPVLRYLVLVEHDQQVFYGGNAHSLVGLDDGPHIMRYPASMLGLIARLANEDGAPYTMSGGFSGRSIHLQPEMNAGEIAGILGIDLQQILDLYSLLVRPQ